MHSHRHQPGSTEHHPSQTSGSVGSTRALHRDKGISAAFTSSSSDTQLLQPKPPLHAAAQAVFDKHLQPPAFKGPKRNNRQLLLLLVQFNTVLDRGEAAGTNMQSNSKSPGTRGRPPTAQLLYLLPAVSLGPFPSSCCSVVPQSRTRSWQTPNLHTQRGEDWPGIVSR